MNVLELAKEFGVPKSKIIRLAHRFGSVVPTETSTLDAKTTALIRLALETESHERKATPRKLRVKRPGTQKMPGGESTGEVPSTVKMPAGGTSKKGVRSTVKMPTSGDKPGRPQTKSPGTGSTSRLNAWSGGFPDVSDRYKIREHCSSQGNEAEVFFGEDLKKKKSRVVIKIYKPEYRPKVETLSQLRGADHRDIINLLEFGDLSPGFYEVMEYAAGGSLQDHFEAKGAGRGFTEEELKKSVIGEAVNGLAFLHGLKIVHRDIKPANIMYKNADQTDIVIGDFGLASTIRDHDLFHGTKRVAGTPEFLAPEAWTASKVENHLEFKLNPEMDYYSLGITLLMLLDANPFLAYDGRGNPIRLMDQQIQVIHLSQPIPMPGDLSPGFSRLLRGLLHKQPESRWGLQEVTDWLDGKEVPLAEEKYITTKSALNYKISGEMVTDPHLLGPVLLRHPKEAMGDIGRGDLAEILRDVDTDLMRMVRQVADLPVSLEARLVEIAHRLTPSMPFRLTRGATADTPKKLAALIDKNAANWNAGLKKLASGEIQAWLRAGGAQALLEEWEEAAEVFAGDKASDAALETFLHFLDEDLPDPKVKLEPRRLHKHRLPGGQTEEYIVRVSSENRGHIFGTFALDQAIEGLTVPDLEIAATKATGRETEIRFEVDTNKMQRGKFYKTQINLNTNGKGRDRISVSLRSTVPWGGILLHGLIGGVVGGCLLGGLRYLVFHSGPANWLVNRPFAEYNDFLPQGDALTTFLKVAIIGGGIVGLLIHSILDSD